MVKFGRGHTSVWNLIFQHENVVVEWEFVKMKFRDEKLLLVFHEGNGPLFGLLFLQTDLSFEIFALDRNDRNP